MLMTLFKNKAFTLIELLVVVSLIGILSAVGIVAYSGYTKSSKEKKAELSLNSINLAQQEYKSNNGNYYYYPSCSNTSAQQISNNLFDGTDTLSDQDFQFCISGGNDTFTITAINRSNNCQITLNQKLQLIRNNNC